MLAPAVTPDLITATHDVIRPHVRRTPVVEVGVAELTGRDGVPATLKLESTQRGGSFKARGAFANLLLREVPAAGVVAASGGNHGVAVALASADLGVAARIFVPAISSAAKVERIRALGADLVVGGDAYADALAASQRWQEESGAMPVHAYDQVETLLGQATLALELVEQAAGLDTVLVPVGGGGLIGGIGAFLAGTARVIGVEPARAPTLFEARRAGEPVDVGVGGVAADALGARRVGSLVFPITQRFVHDVVLVDDDAIRAAQARLWRVARVVAEPAAAVGIAALVAGAYRPEPGERVAVVISGANTSLPNVPE